MNLFITGATGVLGTPVVRLLVDSGHDVRALARNSQNESVLRKAGAEPVRASLFDRSSLRAAIKECEAILHLATRIPRPNQSTNRKAWRDNDRIRIEGTRNLVDEALESDVSTFVYPGIVFAYRDGGADWLDVTTPLDVSDILLSSLKAEAEVERFSKAGKRGVILRMGGFYGPAASSTRDMVRLARYGIAMFVGPSKAYQSLIWVDDAALAIIDGFTRAPAGIYNVVDDEPLQRRELASLLAKTVGRKWLMRPPKFLFRILAGRDMMFLTRSQRVSNRRFKAETGWSPMVPSAREGFRLLAIPP